MWRLSATYRTHRSVFTRTANTKSTRIDDQSTDTPMEQDQPDQHDNSDVPMETDNTDPPSAIDDQHQPDTSSFNTTQKVFWSTSSLHGRVSQNNYMIMPWRLKYFFSLIEIFRILMQTARSKHFFLFCNFKEQPFFDMHNWFMYLFIQLNWRSSAPRDRANRRQCHLPRVYK